ncbi:molybdenum cofactor guanylyltransferase [Fredinandcohnia sp. 179-A 10B2 NHS]|uniref:molybdenum cofactor guanylyltransferase n=1 Tax=Fredinandcohnia sp. 179-A 10B2 NHS TaxID=3235176 RepID=UPI0039A15150
MEQKRIGIILAGGESRRFGTHKAFAQLKNKYFFEHAQGALEGIVEDIIIVSHPATIEKFKENTSFTIIEDLPEYKGNGPLAGILTAMSQKKGNWYVVLPCDTPFVTNQLIEQMLSFTLEKNIDAVIPVIDGRTQPLIGLYHYRVKEKIEKLLNQGQYKMGFLLDSCSVRYVTNSDLSMNGKEFDNINHQSEYEKAKQNEM